MSGAAPTREVAYRVFADEFAESTYSYAESDDERAPQYLVTPTGARINRIFVVGVLTETEEVSDGVLRARIVDPTGAFVLYAGQYQPEALAFFERADPPVFVSLTGKARTFEPDGSDRVLTSLRPERVNEVDAETRDSWVVQTALHTLERTGVIAQALELDEREEALSVRLTAAGVEPGLAAGIPRSIREYGPTTGYLEAVQQMALDAVRVVAGEIDEVSGVGGTPAEGGEGEVLTGFTDVSLVAGADESPDPAVNERESTESGPETEPDTGEVEAESTEAKPSEEAHVEEVQPDEPEAEGQTESTPEPESEPDTESGPETESDAETEPASEPESESDAEPESEPTPETEPEPETAAESATESEEPTEADERYELSEEERAEVEENYDVGFESGAEIGSPEETEDIEPEAGTNGTEAPDTEAEEVVATESATEDTEVNDAASEGDEATAAPEEIESAAEDDVGGDLSEAEREDLVIDTLQELGEGAGVPRTELIETLQTRHDLDEDEIEDAIEAALLGGRCFESGSEDLKPI
ncbi:MAG: hypothetical protein U5K70_07385 [Halodesulfurarchaeum sp.]|nr:hypothetical protein [Halodesulfurarchaeum sp.]